MTNAPFNRSEKTITVPLSEARQGTRHNRPLQVLVLALGLAGCSIPGPASDKEKISAMERGSITIDADEPYEVSYVRGGDPDGPRVIFIHGTPGDAAGWSDYVLNPAEGYEYIAIDRPGFGESGPKGAVTSLKEQAAAFEDLLEERKGQKPILVGHSLGGPIIAQAAVDFPDKIGGLVIAAGSLDPDLEEIHFMQPVGEWFLIRSLLPRAIRNSNQELMALEPHLRTLQKGLKTVKSPIVIVHGTKDTLVPFENVAYMKKEFTGAATLEVVVLKDRNHFLPWHSKDEIDKAIARVAQLMSEP